jgi:hypothetical protein
MIIILFLLGPLVYDNNVNATAHRDITTFKFSDKTSCEAAAATMYKANDIALATCVEVKVP